MKIIIINGPNLNMLGQRQPEIYGHESFEKYFEKLQQLFPKLELDYFQSNQEGALIDKIQEVGFSYDGIVLNAAGYTHTSVAIADAVAAINAPVVEVHISNIHKRESFRHHSFMTPVCRGVIAGLGLHGYRLALDYFVQEQYPKKEV